jgi:excisionase family DNA binding protein
MHPDEVARVLGVSRRTLRRLHQDRVLMHVKVRGKVMYSRTDTHNYLETLASAFNRKECRK